VRQGKTPITTEFPTLAGRRWFAMPRYTLTVLVLPPLSIPKRSWTGGPTGATLSAEGDRPPSLASAAAVARAGPAGVVLLAVTVDPPPPAHTPAEASGWASASPARGTGATPASRHDPVVSIGRGVMTSGAAACTPEASGPSARPQRAVVPRQAPSTGREPGPTERPPPPGVVMDISLRNISMHYIRIHFGYAPGTHILNAL